MHQQTSTRWTVAAALIWNVYEYMVMKMDVSTPLRVTSSTSFALCCHYHYLFQPTISPPCHCCPHNRIFLPFHMLQISLSSLFVVALFIPDTFLFCFLFSLRVSVIGTKLIWHSFWAVTTTTTTGGSTVYVTRRMLLEFSKPCSLCSLNIEKSLSQNFCPLPCCEAILMSSYYGFTYWLRGEEEWADSKIVLVVVWSIGYA